jgi:uncharacterized membrane protein YeiH
MDWPKITGYVGLTSLMIAIIAQVAARILPEDRLTEHIRDVLRWAGYLWAYACACMGIYLAKLTRRLRELVWAGSAAGLCLFCQSGFLVALIYFFWAYAKLDRIGKGLPS